MFLLSVRMLELCNILTFKNKATNICLFTFFFFFLS